jgi:hypothetical protein
MAGIKPPALAKSMATFSIKTPHKILTTEPTEIIEIKPKRILGPQSKKRIILCG